VGQQSRKRVPLYIIVKKELNISKNLTDEHLNLYWTPKATQILAYIFLFLYFIFFIDLKFNCAEKKCFVTHRRERSFRRKQEILLHVELVGFIW